MMRRRAASRRAGERSAAGLPGSFRRRPTVNRAGGTLVAMSVGHPQTPLARKLGIGVGSRVLLAGARVGVVLDPLPLGVTVHRRRGAGGYDVVLLFCPDARTLHDRFGPLLELIGPAGALWACWPKKASGVLSDLSENGVREHGLSCGVVDVKVAAIDLTWSGLKFVRRLADR
jgi:hypothetical protein